MTAQYLQVTEFLLPLPFQLRWVILSTGLSQGPRQARMVCWSSPSNSIGGGSCGSFLIQGKQIKFTLWSHIWQHCTALAGSQESHLRYNVLLLLGGRGLRLRSRQLFELAKEQSKHVLLAWVCGINSEVPVESKSLPWPKMSPISHRGPVVCVPKNHRRPWCYRFLLPFIETSSLHTVESESRRESIRI